MNERFDNANQAFAGGEASVAVNPTLEAKAVKACPNCQNPLEDGQKFCPNCGKTLEEQAPHPLTCANCGAEVPSETKFCPKCGKPIVSPIASITNKKSSKKKKLFLIGGIVAAVLVIATIIILCFAFRDIPVEDIVLSESQIELKEEETMNVSCTVYPSDATNNTVIWSSSDDLVATVNPYGMITAVGKGTCTITAQVGNISKTINVTVKINAPDFNTLYNTINSDAKYGWTLGSDGSYLSADTNVYDLDDYSNSAIWYSIKDMNEKLGLPESINNDMSQTSALMGKQSETYENIGITVTWTYHPDHGLEVTYKHINT
jgi:RNA polymerase subunit RPABC4/transcription elongation factor Spt4